MKCTWKDCSQEAHHNRLDKQGNPWAELCDEHQILLDEAINSGDAKKILSAWVKAQGGAKAATRRM